MKRDQSGVSEVVGAIMLVLIVVVAASSFAIFISQYQESAQAQRLDDQKRAQEKIGVLSIVPEASPDGSEWVSLNFTIASLHKERSEITRIAINDRMVMKFDIYRVSPYTGNLEKLELSALDQLYLASKEQISLHVDLDDPLSMNSPLTISTSGYVKIDISTAWSNEFSKTFAPPSSVATYSSGSWFNVVSGKYEYYATLNGRSSVAYDKAYIVSWEWSLESTNRSNSTMTEQVNLTGPVCRFDYPYDDGNYTVMLTVKDNFGMIGHSTIVFYN